MKNREDIREILDYLQTTEEEALVFDDEAIAETYQKNDGTQSLSIKILSVFGGILTSLAFWGFIAATGIYNSPAGLLIVGSIALVGAIWTNKKYDKIIIDTVTVSSFIIAFIAFGMGFYRLETSTNMICILFIIIAFLSMIIAKNYILSFISTLIICGSILTLILSNKYEDLIHIYVSALTLIISYFYLNEAKIITANKIVSKLYNPIKIGLIFSFIAGLAFLGIRWIDWFSPNFIWLSSVIIILAIIYLLRNLFEILSISKTQHKVITYIIVILALLPTVFSPAISGAILLILLSFLINYKTGFILGIITFIYFIAQYYYDLNFTLLTKSILLFSSGVLFIILYLFTHKKLTTNEKV